MNHAAAVAEVHAAMARLEPEPEHTEHVAKLAVRLFDETREWHRLDQDERVLLEGASCLHDVGWPVSRKGAGHHKHSARVIREQAWTHLTPIEVNLMAMVARYHRKALPCSEHADFRQLERTAKRTVRWLAALLRLADAFDRSHLQIVQDVTFQAIDGRAEFVLVSRQLPAREMAAAQRKGDLAERMFDLELHFRHRTPPGHRPTD